MGAREAFCLNTRIGQYGNKTRKNKVKERNVSNSSWCDPFDNWFGCDGGAYNLFWNTGTIWCFKLFRTDVLHKEGKINGNRTFNKTNNPPDFDDLHFGVNRDFGC